MSFFNGLWPVFSHSANISFAQILFFIRGSIHKPTVFGGSWFMKAASFKPNSGEVSDRITAPAKPGTL